MGWTHGMDPWPCRHPCMGPHGPCLLMFGCCLWAGVSLASACWIMFGVGLESWRLFGTSVLPWQRQWVNLPGLYRVDKVHL
jgi:hypothetical protein